MATSAYRRKAVLGATTGHLQPCSDCYHGFLGIVYLAALPSSDKPQRPSAPHCFGGTCEYLLLRSLFRGADDSGISKQRELKPPTLAALVDGNDFCSGSRELLDR